MQPNVDMHSAGIVHMNGLIGTTPLYQNAQFVEPLSHNVNLLFFGNWRFELHYSRNRHSIPFNSIQFNSIQFHSIPFNSRPSFISENSPSPPPKSRSRRKTRTPKKKKKNPTFSVGRKTRTAKKSQGEIHSQ